jgi:hypothetical protein
MGHPAVGLKGMKVQPRWGVPGEHNSHSGRCPKLRFSPFALKVRARAALDQIQLSGRAVENALSRGFSENTL